MYKIETCKIMVYSVVYDYKLYFQNSISFNIIEHIIKVIIDYITVIEFLKKKKALPKTSY